MATNRTARRAYNPDAGVAGPDASAREVRDARDGDGYVRIDIRPRPRVIYRDDDLDAAGVAWRESLDAAYGDL